MTLPLIVVGTGLAGYSLAREWRKRDPDTPLILISSDAAGFYSKPMLSNALAQQKTAASLVLKEVSTMATELRATIHAHTTVQHLDTAQRCLTLSDGRSLGYRDLVLALGAAPTRLALEGDAADQVMSVNQLSDYAQFAQRLAARQATSVLILGAGLIGCEFANDLASRGIRVTIIDPAASPLSLLLPPAMGQRLAQQLAMIGVRFELGLTLHALHHSETRLQAQLSDGRTLQADVVLSAIGLRPHVALAQTAGIDVARGITTSRLLATSAAHVYAMGDCAQVEGLSLPYVMPIMQQARALAATLSAAPPPGPDPAMPVTVKTPACPTVICPPLGTSTGHWEVTLSDTGAEARYTDAVGTLLGFALMGSATTQRQALAVQVPHWLALDAVS